MHSLFSVGCPVHSSKAHAPRTFRVAVFHVHGLVTTSVGMTSARATQIVDEIGAGQLTSHRSSMVLLVTRRQGSHGANERFGNFSDWYIIGVASLFRQTFVGNNYGWWWSVPSVGVEWCRGWDSGTGGISQSLGLCRAVGGGHDHGVIMVAVKQGLLQRGRQRPRCGG